MKCPACNTKLDSRSKNFCAGCGARLPHPPSHLKWAIGIGIFLFLGILGSMLPDSEPSQTDIGMELFDICNKEIEQKLKAPSTADFGNWSEEKVGISADDDDIYIIDNFVDSENSFGARIRMEFMCKIKVTGENYEPIWTWTDQD